MSCAGTRETWVHGSSLKKYLVVVSEALYIILSRSTGIQWWRHTHRSIRHDCRDCGTLSLYRRYPVSLIAPFLTYLFSFRRGSLDGQAIPPRINKNIPWWWTMWKRKMQQVPVCAEDVRNLKSTTTKDTTFKSIVIETSAKFLFPDCLVVGMA